MCRKVHKQHLQLLRSNLHETPHKSLYPLLFCFCIVPIFYIFSSHSFTVFSDLSYLYIYMGLWLWVCVCGCDLVIVCIGWLRVSLFLFLPREITFVQSHSFHKHTPRLPLTRYIMSVLRPKDQMTITVEPWGRLHTAHLSLSGPRDTGRYRLANRRTATKSHRGVCSLSLQRKNGEGANDP